MTEQTKTEQHSSNKYNRRPGESLLDWYIRISDLLPTIATKLYGYALEKPLREPEIREVCIFAADELMYLTIHYKQVRRKQPKASDYKNVTKSALKQVRKHAAQ